MPREPEKCPECGEETTGGTCLNVDCSRAQHQATRSAARATRKATGTMTVSDPRAFTSSGRVD